MKSIDSVTHIGITVTNIERSIEFYCMNFGFELKRRNAFNEQFFAARPNLYKLNNMTCKTAILVAPDSTALELFEFSSQLATEDIPWNRPGITHIALTTDDVSKMEKQLRVNGVEFCMDVGVRPDGGHWVFVRDPDNNLIEVMEPFNIPV